MDKLDTLSKQAREAMDSGNIDDALRLTREMQSRSDYYLASTSANRFLVNTSGLLIDIGSILKDQRIIQEGVDLLRDNFERIASDDRYAAIVHYDLANGYYAIFHIKKKGEPFAACFSETELDYARKRYEEAINCKLPNILVASQIWVNLGNCFSHLGRVLDALDCYEKAIALKPDHGMALGNKGISLYSYATVAGEHQGTFLVEAYSLLSRALKEGVDTEAIPYFESNIKSIRSRFKGKEHILENMPRYPGYKIKAKSKIENFLIKFCLDHKLYLNICNHCQRCDAAIGDTAVIKKMIVPLGKHDGKDWTTDDQYLRSSMYLNQIKQDYVTARFLLILSRYEELNLDFVDRRVKIMNTLDYSLHNVRVELLKIAFKGFYGILDKVAYFINDYLGLGISDRQISFRTVWYRDPKVRTKIVCSRIQDTKNFSLNALFNLHRDFEDGQFKILRLVRDVLTHRFINVALFRSGEDNENMSEDSLVDRTLELARAARNAILYLLQFVYIEEGKREKQENGFIPTLYAQEIPDDLKS